MVVNSSSTIALIAFSSIPAPSAIAPPPSALKWQRPYPASAPRALKCKLIIGIHAVGKAKTTINGRGAALAYAPIDKHRAGTCLIPPLRGINEKRRVSLLYGAPHREYARSRCAQTAPTTKLKTDCFVAGASRNDRRIRNAEMRFLQKIQHPPATPSPFRVRNPIKGYNSPHWELIHEQHR